MSAHVITRWRAARLRARIQADRCPKRPGITHHWTYTQYPDWTSQGYLDVTECEKCGEWRL